MCLRQVCIHALSHTYILQNKDCQSQKTWLLLYFQITSKEKKNPPLIFFCWAAGERKAQLDSDRQPLQHCALISGEQFLNTCCILQGNLSPHTNVPWACQLRYMRHNVFGAKERAEHEHDLESRASIAAYLACKESKVLVAVAGAEGPHASCNCPHFPSPADMQYHLSKYLDNWIWEGSPSRHYNQWHCQQCHWEAASSCTMGRRTEVNVFSTGWLDREADHKSPGSMILLPSHRDSGRTCLQLHVMWKY